MYVYYGLLSYMSFIRDTGVIFIPICYGLKYSNVMSINYVANRHLFSTDPPYWSFLLLDYERKNVSIKYPCAPCNWIPSNPLSCASLILFL